MRDVKCIKNIFCDGFSSDRTCPLCPFVLQCEVCAFSQTCKKHLGNGEDQQLWRWLCQKQEYPLRKRCDHWKVWYRRMEKRLPVKYRFEKEEEEHKVLVGKEETIDDLIFKVSVMHVTAPHRIGVYAFERNRELCSTPVFHGHVLTLFVKYR
ncbi:F-box containing protein [Brazilian marseillevirus]|uniref:F-box containing protein n=1 Tax=Brazilian marseillevirus TaxID=1813599 RepID=UPI000781FD30|nr:F-box containing protein [Brazilian marseillevirus]AMQ10565.1 F-box containing protein [Brazilian marseillevirus]